MVLRAASPCRASGCRALVSDGSGRCPKHTVRKELVKRESSSKRGYNYAWQKARAGYLAKHPYCCMCTNPEEFKWVDATDVDHIIPHQLDEALKSGDPEWIARAKQLFWDSKNWQGLCHSCHSVKTASEDGGFGNKRPPRLA